MEDISHREIYDRLIAVEHKYGVEARDATWAKLYEVMADVEAGTRPMPAGYADIEPELPVLEWPN